MLNPTTQPPVELRDSTVSLRAKHVVCSAKVLTSYIAINQSGTSTL